MSEDRADRDRKADEREAELDRREKNLDARRATAKRILEDADERDAVSDSRDQRDENHEAALDKARAMAHGATYDAATPERHAAIAHRDHAKNDRTASKDDRETLAADLDDPDFP